MKIKKPTHTATVEAYLRARDDFATFAMIADANRMTIDAVRTTLYHMRHYRVVDCVVEPNGVAWWFALPRDLDTRKYKIEEIAPIGHPRKPRSVKLSRAIRTFFTSAEALSALDEAHDQPLSMPVALYVDNVPCYPETESTPASYYLASQVVGARRVKSGTWKLWKALT